MVDELQLHRTSTSRHKTIVKAVSRQPQSDLCVEPAKDQPQSCTLLPKLDILAVDPDEELQEEWEAEDDVNKVFVGHGGVRVLH